MAKRLTWLHLSDWHQKGKDFDRDVVRDALLTDLRDRTAIDPALAQVDLVIFSGDLAYHGRAEEYQAAQTLLLDPVLKAVGLGPERLFMVPGNHDLDRVYAKKMLPPDLQKPLESTDQVSEWLTDSEYRDGALKPFRNYVAFVSGYTPQTDPAYASRMGLKLDAGTVHLLGLNTAWMSRGDKDQLSLILGEPQIHEGLKWLQEGDIRIVVQHHPFEWLARFDRDQVERPLRQGADFLLWGHEHCPSPLSIQGPGADCVTMPAGATYERRRTDNSRYINAYNLIGLDLDSGQGTAFLRRWGETRTQWIADTETTDGGRYSFALPKRIVTGRAEAIPLRGESPVEHAGKCYRDLLLKSCDIIDLASLPGQDRLLVQRQLDLRRLFVPLHVRVEPSPDDAEAWVRIEARRQSGPKEDGTSDRVPVGSRLGAAKRLIILGDPGGGKTTLIRWIATAYLLKLKQDLDHSELPEVATLPDESWLPVLIRCRDLDKDGCIDTLDTMLAQSLRKAELSPEEVPAVQAHIHAEIKHKRALLIIDGLDEVTDAGKRAQLCNLLEEIAHTHPDLPIIATSRIVGYREMGRRLGRGFEHLTLCDLSPEDKDSFAKRWCALTLPAETAATAAEDLIRDIRSNERVQRLTGNPMLLTTMALVKRSIGRLPQKRAELYVEAVKALLNWRNDKGERLEADEALPQLHYVAYAMCDRGVQTLRRDELLDLIAEMRMAYPNIHDAGRHTPAQFIDLLESRTGILIQSGHVRHQGEEVAIYEFRHLTFQEFLAAQALVKRIHPGYAEGQTLAKRVEPLARRVAASEESEERRQEGESWREVLRLCLTLCDPADVDPALLAILGSPQYSRRRSRAILATQCLSDEPNAGDEAGQMVLVEFAKSIQGDSYYKSDVHNVSVSLMETRWGDAWKECLVDQIIAEAPAINEVLILHLENIFITTYSNIDLLPIDWLEKVSADLKGSLRQRVATAVAIKEVVDSERLTEYGDIGRILVNLLSRDSLTEFTAIGVLHAISGTNADIPIEPVLQFMHGLDINSQAAYYCCGFFERRPHDVATPDLIRCLGSVDMRTRIAAVWALGATGGPEVGAALRSMLTDSAQRVRKSAVRVLGRNQDETDRRLLNDSDDSAWFYPLDPADPITPTRITTASKALNLPITDIIARYRALAPEFGLTLAPEVAAMTDAPSKLVGKRNPKKALAEA